MISTRADKAVTNTHTKQTTVIIPPVHAQGVNDITCITDSRDPASSGQSKRWNVIDQRKNVVLAN